jgi:hypothetical protein
MIIALYHLQLLPNRFEPIISIHRVHSIRKGWQLSAVKISEPIPRQWWHLVLCMQVDQGLLYGLKHLCLYSKHLLKSSRGGGGGLASWLLFSPLFSALLAATWFRVLTI